MISEYKGIILLLTLFTLTLSCTHTNELAKFNLVKKTVLFKHYAKPNLTRVNVSIDDEYFYNGLFINAENLFVSGQNIILQYGVPAEEEIISNELKLSNYPNPFNPTTTISFCLTAKDAENAKLEIFNIKGRKVKVFSPDVILRGFEGSAGVCTVIWDGTDYNNQPVPSGIYFYKLALDGQRITRKMTLLK